MTKISVELIDHMGDDLRVVDAARVSFNKKSEWEVDDWTGFYPKDQCTDKYLSDKDERLIKYLANHDHFTPFTHCQITLREKVPIFVARQRFKHVVGFTYNEVSRRYVDEAPEFYEPESWRKAANNKKQGSSEETVDHFGDHGFSSTAYQSIGDAYFDSLNVVSGLYSDLLHAGVAPEQARMILPQSMMTEYFVTGSLAAFARAYNLRIDSHAQKEIQDLAKEWDRVISSLFPVSWRLLTGEKDAG